VILTNPVANASFTSNSNIQVAADASDSDGNIVKVEFFQGSTKLGEDSTSPYSFAWNNVASGNYSLTARATDNNGYQTTSSSVAISVGSDFNSLRLDPDNATGGTGENPLSRNFNWSLLLVGLPGRAGLDLGLTLTYNSLVWTKDTSGTLIKYDVDQGFPSPGFRLGFPLIEQKYYSSQTGKDNYLMITPSGSRVELRYVAPYTYESADSSHLQLTEGTGLTVRTSDGTQLPYLWQGNVYQCTEIKDRNGNFITIGYNNGQLSTVTDTLGRVISFNYDSNNRLASITQQWKPASTVVTYKWGSLPTSIRRFRQASQALLS
jgi:YD repeat-containing protein